MGPIAAGADIKVVLQNVAARLPLGLHLDVADVCSEPNPRPAHRRKNVVVEIVLSPKNRSYQASPVRQIRFHNMNRY